MSCLGTEKGFLSSYRSAELRPALLYFVQLPWFFLVENNASEDSEDKEKLLMAASVTAHNGPLDSSIHIHGSGQDKRLRPKTVSQEAWKRENIVGYCTTFLLPW